MVYLLNMNIDVKGNISQQIHTGERHTVKFIK